MNENRFRLFGSHVVPLSAMLYGECTGVIKFFAAAFVVTFLASTSAYAAPCMQGARYERKDGAYISISTPSESADGLDRAHFELQSLGNVVAGAPTVGNLEGELTFTRDSCAGFFTSPNIPCALIVTFNGNRAQAYQIGYCYSGAGAYADGVYFKIKAKPSKAPAMKP
jgi:hypothetical protein